MNAKCAYEEFVGIPPEKFLAPFNGDVEKAMDSLMSESWWGSYDVCPSYIRDLITEYITEYLESVNQ